MNVAYGRPDDFRRFLRRVVAGVVFAVAAMAAGEETGLREWTSVDGRVLEARILRVGDGKVRMERSDGRVFTIPISRFGEEDRGRIRDWAPPPIKEASPDEAVLTLEFGEGRGSGVLVREDGRVWVYTNQHVLGDARSVRAVDTAGERIPLGELEIARKADLARFATKVRRGMPLADSGGTGDTVVVYGNSQGTGVITRAEGKILGVSPGAFEVSAGIVAGNSGGPVVGEDGAVLGISSFVRFRDPGSDPTVEDTRYERPRRFALRLDRPVDFAPVGREEFRRAYDAYWPGRRTFDEAVRLVRSVMKKPLDRVVPGDFETEPIREVAEDHNDDIDRVPGLKASGMSRRNMMRKLYGRFFDTLETALEEAESALSRAERGLDDPRFGWMRAGIESRKEQLPAWRNRVEDIREVYD